jgi:hypothetical protein
MVNPAHRSPISCIRRSCCRPTRPPRKYAWRWPISPRRRGSYWSTAQTGRTRFLLAVTGPYGHALHARRAAARLADKPHLVDDDASALTVLDVIAAADRQRSGDDVIVVDAAGRCRGIVRVTELVRGIAEAGTGGRPGRHSR